MKYPKSYKYDKNLVMQKIMGPNPIKLEEELLLNHKIAPDSLVIDLGSGQGLTSVFLAKEYNFRVFAVDLWSNPTDNKKFFERMGLNDKQIMPLSADATALPFAEETFDAVVCTDSYNYFGRDKNYLQTKLLPFVKHGGYIYISVPGMKKDCHSHLPSALCASWTAEQLDYIHDIKYWQDIIGETQGIEILEISEMQSNEEVWQDWVECDNDYAKLDRKAVAAGCCEYLNFIKIVILKK